MPPHKCNVSCRRIHHLFLSLPVLSMSERSQSAACPLGTTRYGDVPFQCFSAVWEQDSSPKMQYQEPLCKDDRKDQLHVFPLQRQGACMPGEDSVQARI